MSIKPWSRNLTKCHFNSSLYQMHCPYCLNELFLVIGEWLNTVNVLAPISRRDVSLWPPSNTQLSYNSWQVTLTKSPTSFMIFSPVRPPAFWNRRSLKCFESAISLAYLKVSFWFFDVFGPASMPISIEKDSSIVVDVWYQMIFIV